MLEIRNDCLSVIPVFSLSSVYLVGSFQSTRLCKGLKYSLKVQIIPVVLNIAGFSIFDNVFLGRTKNCPMSEKIKQKWAAFAFGSTYLHQTFTEYMSNQYTLLCQIWLKDMEGPFISLHFWVFSCIIIDKHSCLKYCFFTKLSQRDIIIIKLS